MNITGFGLLKIVDSCLNLFGIGSEKLRYRHKKSPVGYTGLFYKWVQLEFETETETTGCTSYEAT